MLVKAKIESVGIRMGKTYESLGFCSKKEYFIVLNDFGDMFPYLVEKFDMVGESLTKKEKFRAMIESKTFLIE